MRYYRKRKDTWALQFEGECEDVDWNEINRDGNQVDYPAVLARLSALRRKVAREAEKVGHRKTGEFCKMNSRRLKAETEGLQMYVLKQDKGMIDITYAMFDL